MRKREDKPSYGTKLLVLAALGEERKLKKLLKRHPELDLDTLDGEGNTALHQVSSTLYSACICSWQGYSWLSTLCVPTFSTVHIHVDKQPDELFSHPQCQPSRNSLFAAPCLHSAYCGDCVTSRPDRLCLLLTRFGCICRPAAMAT